MGSATWVAASGCGRRDAGRFPGVSEAHSSVNKQLGPYLIEEQLGVGGMGNVYRALHTKLKRPVALKVLPATRWSNAVAVSRFEREMEAIGGLDHPNIVRASDAGEDQGMHYLVMEYVDGLDLAGSNNSCSCWLEAWK